MTSTITPLQEQYITWGTPVVLRKDIAGIQALASASGKPSLGIVLRLPRGLRVEVCGGGFSAGTVKVRSQDDFFFVLRRHVVE